MACVTNKKDEDIKLSSNFIDIKNSTFGELLENSRPVTEKELEHIKELTEGVEVDLDAPLSDDE